MATRNGRSGGLWRECGALLAALSLLAISARAAVVWVKVLPEMERITWSQVEDIELVDRECRSDHTLPRVCLYRHLSRCRIIATEPPNKIARKTVLELERMCGGWFPEPVLGSSRFSDPNYLPNQSPPSVDPVWQYQNR